MKVSLTIEGDSSGAQKAAADTSRAVDDMAKSVASAARDLSGSYADIEAAARMTGIGTKEYAAALGKAYGIQGELKNSQVDTIRQYETLIGMLSQGRAREAAQLVAVRQAGTTADTQYGKTVAMLSGNLYDLEEQQNRTGRSGSNFADTITRRVIGAFVVTELKNFVSQLWSLNQALTSVGDTAKRVSLSGSQFQGLEAAAGFKGISTADLNAGAMSLAKNLNEGVKYSNELRQLFVFNGRSLTDSAGNAKNLVDVLAEGADMVRNARTEQDKLIIAQQLGLPVTAQWLKLLEQGGSALKQTIVDAQRNGLAATDAAIEKAAEFDEKWNRAWTNISMRARGFFGEVIDGIGSINNSPQWKLFMAGIKLVPLMGPLLRAGEQLGGLAADPQGKIGSRPQNYAYRNAPITLNDVQNSIGTGKPTGIATDKLKDIGIEQQRLALLGSTTSALEAQLVVENTFNQARLAGIPVDEKRVEILKRLAYENNLGITAIKASSDNYRIEAETIGMTVGQAAAYVAVQNQIAEARRNGKPLLDDEIANIQREADAMGRSAQATDNLKFAFSATQDTVRTFGQSLRQGATVWDSFAAAGVNALGKIADKLTDLAVSNLWTKAFGGTSGSSLFGGLFGGGSSEGVAGLTGGGVASGGMNGMPVFLAAGGGSFGDERWGVVGEQGPELIKTHTGGGVTVYSNDNSRRMLAGGMPGFAKGGGFDAFGRVMSPPIVPGAMTSTQRDGGGGSVTFAPVTHIDARGADQAAVERIQRSLDRRDAEFEAHVRKIVGRRGSDRW